MNKERAVMNERECQEMMYQRWINKCYELMMYKAKQYASELFVEVAHDNGRDF